MKHGYIVVVQDQEPNGFGQIGYIGNIELDHKLYPKSMVAIGEDLYFIKEIRTDKISTIYVHKVQKAKLHTEEYESDIRKQTLGTIMSFLAKYNITPTYYHQQVQMIYDSPRGSHHDIIAAGSGWAAALRNVRNEMIDKGIIQRGEW